MSQSLGELIRERRLGLGFSLGQLATKMATTVSVVRGWERDEDVPPEQARRVLAGVLALDGDEVAELAEAAARGRDEPAEEEPESPTELVQSAAGVAMTSVSPPVQAVASEPGPRDESAEPEIEPGPAQPEPAEVDREPAPARAAILPEPETGPRVEDPSAPRPVPLRYPHSVPAGVAVEISEPEANIWNPLRYLYDPDKPWLYWIRAALTVVVLLFLFNLLFDSVGELFDKLGDVIDSIEPSDAVEGDVTDAETGET
jgi:transcriptional regulator with XRE-family HTH domain